MPVTKVCSGKLVQYSYCLDAIPNRRDRNVQDKNLTRGAYNGYMSSKTKSFLRERLSNWLLAGRMHAKYGRKDVKINKPYFTFATLTLPAKQVHTDNEIKRKCLNTLLIALQRKWNVVNYFWRAEPQANGNLHFHIILDRYIPNHRLQQLWNQSVSGLGYLERFAQVYGHYNPPSTHVVKLNGHQAAIKYLSKYLSKNEQRRKVGGRIWGSSDHVRKFASVSMETTLDHSELVQLLAEDPATFKISGKYFGALFGNVYEMCEQHCPNLWRHIIASLINQYETCYAFDEPVPIVVETPVFCPPKRVTKSFQLGINYSSNN